MNTKHIKVLIDGQLIKISCRTLADGTWSVVGWGNFVSLRSTDTEIDQNLNEFARYLLYINDLQTNSKDIDIIVNKIEEAIR